MDDNGNVKGHRYYKFAYNRQEYRKAGFNDSLNNTQHRQFVNSKPYENGYLTADAYTIDGKVNKKTINSGKNWFKTFKKMGPATAPAIDQIKWEAHIDTL
ncbi:MAG: Hypothetical protein AJITA_00654 [Acetilactobacillus jinshanensis]